MNLVAFDTSTESCSVAVQVGDEVRVDHRLVQREHAALLLPMLQGLLNEFDLKPNQLEGVVFGRGPGSFTGVRIAAAAAQGLAVAANCGVHGVSSLEALAQGCVRARRETGKSVHGVLAAFDARMNQIYTNVYQTRIKDGSGVLLALSDERVVDPEACALPLLKWLSTSGLNTSGLNLNQENNSAATLGSIVLCGRGAEVYEKEIRAGLSAVFASGADDSMDPTRIDAQGAMKGDTLGATKRFSIELEPDIFPNALDLLALTSAAEVDWKSPEYAQPTYLRNKVALTLAERSSH